MLKSKLIDSLSAKQSHFNIRDISLAVNSIVDTMIEALGHGNRIEIRGFGSFALHYRAPRQAHNPKTGQKLTTQPKYAVHFKPGKEMRERINASRDIPISTSEEEEII